MLRRPVRTVADWAQKGKLPFVLKLEGKRGAYLFARTEIEKQMLKEAR